jgi:hypothetical protein
LIYEAKCAFNTTQKCEINIRAWQKQNTKNKQQQQLQRLHQQQQK